MAKDPICDMEVDEQTAEFKSQYGGQTYYFAQKPFKGKTCRIAAVFNDSCSNAALFLCNPDCVAERMGFEPSVPFLRCS